MRTLNSQKISLKCLSIKLSEKLGEYFLQLKISDRRRVPNIFTSQKMLNYRLNGSKEAKKWFFLESASIREKNRKGLINK